MKSLKLLAVAAIFGAFMTSCEADSINEDDQLIEEMDVYFGTEKEVDKPEGSGGD